MKDIYNNVFYVCVFVLFTKILFMVLLIHYSYFIYNIII